MIARAIALVLFAVVGVVYLTVAAVWIGDDIQRTRAALPAAFAGPLP